MKVKTSELTGAALDYIVAKCEGRDIILLDGEIVWRDEVRYSTDWALGGPLIEREKIALVVYWNGRWVAEPEEAVESVGDTPLIAAMRCLVARKIGDEVEVPEELCERS